MKNRLPSYSRPQQLLKETTVLNGKTDTSRLHSRHVTTGPSRAPQRLYHIVTGQDHAQIEQHFVGVATCRNDAAPCNISMSGAVGKFAKPIGPICKGAINHPKAAEDCRIRIDL